MTNIDVSNYLPPSHRNQFWIDFCDSLSDELQLFKDNKVLPFKDFYVVDNIDDEEQLLLLLKMMGYDVNRILDSSLEFLRNEIKSLVYKVKRKATYRGYQYFHKLFSLNCDIFNVYYEGSKLCVAIDIENTLNNFNTFDKTKYFNLIEPIYNFSSIQNIDIELDNYNYDITLDNSVVWTLDRNLVTIPTKHISVFYFPKDLIIKDSKEYLVTSDYMNYLRSASSYNRRTTEIVHNGLNLSFACSGDGVYNFFSNDTYSIPNLKINCQATPTYIGKQVDNKSLFLDNSDELDLDKDIFFVLDNEYNYKKEKNPSDLFFTVCAGIGKRNLIPKQYIRLQNIQNLLFYYDFDDVLYEGNTFKDSSPNDRTMTITHQFGQSRNGIIGKSLLCQGTTPANSTMGTVENILISTTKMSLCFWINGLDSNQSGITPPELKLDVDAGGGTYYLDLDKAIPFEMDNEFNKNVGICFVDIHGFLKVYYDYITHKLYCRIDGNTDFAILEDDFTLDGTDTYINVVINTNTAYLYVNSILKFTADISGIGTFQSSYTMNVANDTVTKFTGSFDELKLYNIVLTQDEITFLYDNKIGGLRYLENEVSCERISEREITTATDLFYINSYLRANYITNEYMFLYHEDTLSYSGITRYSNITKKTFKIYYYNSLGSYIIEDNGDGTLSNDFATGTINYQTGAYTVNFYKTKKVYNEYLDTNVSSINTTLGHKNIVQSNCKIKFIINDVPIEVTDNGLGNFPTSADLIEGTINYETGLIHLVFSDTVEDIEVTYLWNDIQQPLDNQRIVCSYAVNDKLNLTEFGIKNSSGELVAYATTPNTEFYDNDTIYMSWFIYK